MNTICNIRMKRYASNYWRKNNKILWIIHPGPTTPHPTNWQLCAILNDKVQMEHFGKCAACIICDVVFSYTKKATTSIILYPRLILNLKVSCTRTGKCEMAPKTKWWHLCLEGRQSPKIIVLLLLRYERWVKRPGKICANEPFWPWRNKEYFYFYNSRMTVPKTGKRVYLHYTLLLYSDGINMFLTHIT